MTEGSFEGLGGLRIFTRAWRPATQPRAVVLISHGFNSHSGEYFWVAEQLVADGLRGLRAGSTAAAASQTASASS